MSNELHSLRHKKLEANRLPQLVVDLAIAQLVLRLTLASSRMMTVFLGGLAGTGPPSALVSGELTGLVEAALKVTPVSSAKMVSKSLSWSPGLTFEQLQYSTKANTAMKVKPRYFITCNAQTGVPLAESSHSH